MAMCANPAAYYSTGTPFTKSAAILAKVRGTIVAFFDPLPGSMESIAVGTHGNPVVKLVVEVDRSLYCVSPELALNVGSLHCRNLSGVGGRPESTQACENSAHDPLPSSRLPANRVGPVNVLAPRYLKCYAS
jgi:hypothetical protein